MTERRFVLVDFNYVSREGSRCHTILRNLKTRINTTDCGREGVIVVNGWSIRAAQMSRQRRTKPRAKLAASRVTNGSRLFLPGVDGRSAIARRTRDIFDQLCTDLGGHDQLSEAQTQLCRRAAMISISCEQMEAESAAGDRIDLDLFGKLTDRLGRTLQRLGIKRVPRDVTPSVVDFVAHINANEAA